VQIDDDDDDEDDFKPIVLTPQQCVTDRRIDGQKADSLCALGMAADAR